MKTIRIGVVALGLLGLVPVTIGQQSRTARPPARTGATGVRSINESHAISGEPRRQGLCSGVLPSNWVFVPGRDGSNVEAYTPNRDAYAGWIIRAINPAMRPYYGDMYGPPDVSNLSLVQALTHMPVSYTSAPQQTPFFVIRNFQSGNYTGAVLYHAFPAPYGSAPGSYILSSYVVYAERGRKDLFKVAQAVMTTLNCTTALHPTSPGPSDIKRGARGSEGDALKGYNAQTGKQWAHSPSTGKNYLLDAATDWNESGPDGPGYYRKAGNTYEKLENGWQ